MRRRRRELRLGLRSLKEEEGEVFFILEAVVDSASMLLSVMQETKKESVEIAG